MTFLTSPFLFIIAGAVVAFSFYRLGRSMQGKEIKNLKKNIDDLENEVVQSQREIINLEDQLMKRITASISGTPVIPIPASMKKHKLAK